MKRKKLLSYFLSILLVTLMPVSILADTYYIDDGDITILNTGTQIVKQGSTSNNDDAPVITQRDSNTATNHKIAVHYTPGDNVATFTIKDVNIKSENSDIDTVDGNGIDVDVHKAEITIEGNNKVDAARSAIRVTSGNLTIKGDGTLTVNSSDNSDAKIGSDVDKKMSGTIHITDDVTITGVSGSGTNGAVIGSGENGDLSGDIIIDGNATVNVTGGNGAIIGSGNNGDLTGSITIGDNATVNASSQGDGSAIGSGNDGNLSGSITIEGDASVVAKSYEGGSAIGSGKDGDLSGTVVIKDNAEVVAYAKDDGSAIGTGAFGDLAGTIEITDDATVTAVGRKKWFRYWYWKRWNC